VYWRQFTELMPTLERSSSRISQRITDIGADVKDFGFVSDPIAGAAVADRIRSANVDLIVLFVSTYMPSAQVLPIFKYGGAPVLLMCLQPSTSMDHETFGTGEWLSFAGSAALPEMCVAMERLGLPARTVSGHLDDERHV
jgi:L-arabinose isomerase